MKSRTLELSLFLYVEFSFDLDHIVQDLRAFRCTGNLHTVIVPVMATAPVLAN